VASYEKPQSLMIRRNLSYLCCGRLLVRKGDSRIVGEALENFCSKRPMNYPIKGFLETSFSDWPGKWRRSSSALLQFPLPVLATTMSWCPAAGISRLSLEEILKTLRAAGMDRRGLPDWREPTIHTWLRP